MTTETTQIQLNPLKRIMEMLSDGKDNGLGETIANIGSSLAGMGVVFGGAPSLSNAGLLQLDGQLPKLVAAASMGRGGAGDNA